MRPIPGTVTDPALDSILRPDPSDPPPPNGRSWANRTIHGLLDEIERLHRELDRCRAAS